MCLKMEGNLHHQLVLYLADPNLFLILDTTLNLKKDSLSRLLTESTKEKICQEDKVVPALMERLKINHLLFVQEPSHLIQKRRMKNKISLKS
jgi:hypothetical protein